MFADNQPAYKSPYFIPCFHSIKFWFGLFFVLFCFWLVVGLVGSYASFCHSCSENSQCGNVEFGIIGNWSEFCVVLVFPVLSVHCGSKRIEFPSTLWELPTAGNIRETDKLLGFRAGGWNLLEPFSLVFNGYLRVERRRWSDIWTVSLMVTGSTRAGPQRISTAIVSGVLGKTFEAWKTSRDLREVLQGWPDNQRDWKLFCGQIIGESWV